MDNIQEFKKEFKELLQKYDAHIEWDAEGDLDGIYNDRMTVCVEGKAIISVESFGETICAKTFD